MKLSLNLRTAVCVALILLSVPAAKSDDPLSLLKDAISSVRSGLQKGNRPQKGNDGREDIQPEEQTAEDANGISVSDPNFEWTQFDDKSGHAILEAKGLELESKNSAGAVWSYTELPLDVKEGMFTIGLTGVYDKAENDKQFGVIFDIKNDRNYKLITFEKKQYVYQTCENGELSTVKRGMIKLPKSKTATMTLKKTGSIINVSLNGLDVTRLKNIDLNYPTFGYYVKGKNKFIGQSFFYDIEEADETEESTTD